MDSQTSAQTNTPFQNLALLDDIVETIRPGDDSAAARIGLEAFLKHLTVSPDTEVSAGLVDQLIADLDDRIAAQVNAVLHDETFQQLESTWRGLQFLVDHTDFHQNIKIECVNVSKKDLLADFEDSPEVTKSGLYRHVYTAEYGQFGGQPVGAILADYAFGPGPQDVQLLHFVAAVAAMAHAPFIAAADRSFFGIGDWEELPNIKDVHSLFEMPQYARWYGFRENEDARYVGLTLPRFLLRVPYGPETVPAKSFSFTEEMDDTSHFCWGNTAFVFGSRLSASFALYRWCTNIIGPQGGGCVDYLPVYTYESMGQVQTKIPTEVLISERREFELAKEGFIALTMRKGADNAAFFSANSCLRARAFPLTAEGRESERNHKLSLQLPYMMIMNRLAHYIKVIQRENIGTWKERPDLERELNKWISQYVTEMDDPDPATRNRRPLRMAQIMVNDVSGEPGWYSVELLARPHFKYMGASFTLSLVGKLDKA